MRKDYSLEEQLLLLLLQLRTRLDYNAYCNNPTHSICRFHITIILHVINDSDLL